MAVRTGIPLAVVRAGVNREPRVSKCRSGPSRRGVARLASRRKSSRDMIRVGRVPILRCVTGVAIRGRIRVVAVQVAIRARDGCVRAGQRETGDVVIESRRLPGGRVVAHSTRLWESGLHVVRVRRTREIRQMAGRARGAQTGEDAVHMACGAGNRDVRAGQWEICGVMVERSSRPGRCGVACRAVRREAGLDVIGIGGTVEIRQVAADAGLRRARESPVDVAGLAAHAHMRAGERETGHGVVIKARAGPSGSRVAVLAGGREAGLDVIGIGGTVEIRQVAADAGLRRARELPVDVAGLAAHAHMRAGERETGHGVVIKARAGPSGSRVAVLAGGREAGLDVIGIGGAVEIRQVAADAGLRRARESPVDVAGTARDAHVRAGQRKLREGVVIKRRARPGNR